MASMFGAGYGGNAAALEPSRYRNRSALAPSVGFSRSQGMLNRPPVNTGPFRPSMPGMGNAGPMPPMQKPMPVSPPNLMGPSGIQPMPRPMPPMMNQGPMPPMIAVEPRDQPIPMQRPMPPMDQNATPSIAIDPLPMQGIGVPPQMPAQGMPQDELRKRTMFSL